MIDKDYENIVSKNDKFKEDTEIALGLVKKYVISNKLIIVGGMAIDYALRLKGDKLYDDNVLPDYDFYSPNYNKDAYKIAELLHSAGLSNISVINANHVSTMRVIVNYTVVADVTYMPINIFDNLPTLLYRDIIIIHPHYQLIDQHRSLSLPFENPPLEVILNRWQKDSIRYDILYKYYPLEKFNSSPIELTDEITISNIMFKNQCISGFVGLLYWESLAKKYGFPSKKTKGAGVDLKESKVAKDKDKDKKDKNDKDKKDKDKKDKKDNEKSEDVSLGVIQEDPVGFVVRIPKDSHGVSLYCDDIKNTIELVKNMIPIKSERQYSRFIDKLPYKTILNNTWELLDNKGYLLGATNLKNDLFIANLQNIMLYMLTNLILLQNIKEENRGYSFYVGYLRAQAIVKWAAEKYAESNGPNSKYLKFLPTVEVYGESEISDSYLNSKRLFLEKLEKRKNKDFQPKLIFPNTFVKGKIPKKYFQFIPENSPILQFDGKETKHYIDRIDIYNS